MTLDSAPDTVELASNEVALHSRLSVDLRKYAAFGTETYEPEHDRWTLTARHDASSTFVIEGVPSTPDPDAPA